MAGLIYITAKHHEHGAALSLQLLILNPEFNLEEVGLLSLTSIFTETAME
jgi:hypothetical protein